MLSKLIEIFLISVLPISLIKFDLISKKFRLIILALIFVVVFFLVELHDISFYDLGFRTNNFYPAIFVYLIAVMIAVLFLIFLSQITKTKKAEMWYKDPHFLFLFIPISFAQQFLFQGFILYELQSIFPAVLAIVVSALIFGYLHTIYPRPVFSFILGTLAGLFFAMLYTLYPNLIISSIVHMILNFTAVYLGFFTFTDER